MQFTRTNKKTTRRIIVLSVLAAVTIALALTVWLLSRVTAAGPAAPTPATPVEILDGEGRYLSYATAYPPLTENVMMSIEIDNEKGHYIIARPNGHGSFRFVYFDENGEEHIYYPDIMMSEEDFIYDDLYAKVTGDGYDMIPMLTYLTSALRAPYFDDRIYLDEDPAKRNEQLLSYGLPVDGDTSTRRGAILLHYAETYVDENGETQFVTDEDGEYVYKKHTVEIGSNTVTGSGYYFRVDGRDYIYVTQEYNYFHYALVGVEEFVNPVLITAGLESVENALTAPYLTPSYRQWLNTVYDTDAENDKHASAPFPTEDGKLRDISSITASLNVYMPSFTRENEKDITDSYITEKLGETLFDVTEYKDNKLYPNFLAALSGKEMTDVDLSQSFLYEKKASDGSTQVYKIKKIEGVVTSDAGDRKEGAVGDAKYVKVLYELLVDGEKKNIVYNTVTNSEGKTEIKEISVPYHGILDLEALDKAGIDTSGIRALSVGDEPKDLEITVNYEKNDDTGLSYSYARYYVQGIVAIYEYTYDDEGNVTGVIPRTKPTADSVVVYRYYYTFDGKLQPVEIGMIDWKAKEDEEFSEQKDRIRAAIKTMIENNESEHRVAYTEYVFDDVMSDYVTYEFKDVRAYVESELIIGFGFVNASERDPFYGESFYEKHDDVKMLYAINQSSCEKVVKILGGIAETSKAEGLVGIKTVKVGITHNDLVKYGCYANQLEFKLPRDTYSWKETEEDELDDMGFMSTLDFVLYISDPEYDPESGKTVRYVASKMYDIIVTIDADEIGFVGLDAVDFWARRNLILIDSIDLREIQLRFNMTDLKGAYNFVLSHNTMWKDSATGQIVPNKPESGIYSEYDAIDVSVRQLIAAGVGFDDFLAEKSKNGTAMLSDFYDYVRGSSTAIFEGNDLLGTAAFKNLTLMLFYTHYTGTLTDEEQAAVFDPNGDGNSDDAMSPMMSFKVNLNDTDPNSDTKKWYNYEFYRCDDRRVMVRIYETKNGEVIDGVYASDFYISILAYRKIVSGFVGILNGEMIDVEDPYPDYMN